MKKIIGIVLLIVLTGCTKQGKEMTLKLEGNPTTGYSWECIIEDTAIIENISTDYISENDENLSGVGGYYYIKFIGLKEGKTDITCNYQRSWETVEPIYSLNYKIEVTNDNIIKFLKSNGNYEGKIIPAPEFE